MIPFSRRPDGFVIHHSATVDGATYSWAAIRHFHITDPAHLWDDIGYHMGIELLNAEYEASLGRPWDMRGAHCPQDAMNGHTWGICLVGNFDAAPPPHEQLRVLFKRVLLPFARLSAIPLNRDTVTFHRDHARDGRTCPGTAFTNALLDQCLAEFSAP